MPLAKFYNDIRSLEKTYAHLLRLAVYFAVSLSSLRLIKNLKSNLYLVSWVPSPGTISPSPSFTDGFTKSAQRYVLGRLETRGQLAVERIAKGRERSDAGDTPMAVSGLHHIRPSSGRRCQILFG